MTNRHGALGLSTLPALGAAVAASLTLAYCEPRPGREPIKPSVQVQRLPRAAVSPLEAGWMSRGRDEALRERTPSS